MFNRFFHWLESRVDPFPPDRPQMPPPGLLAFAWHYTKPFWPLLAVSMLFSAAIAFLEVYEQQGQASGNVVNLVPRQQG